jgi:hypothetical protein
MQCVDSQILAECDEYCARGRNCKWQRRVRLRRFLEQDREAQEEQERGALLQVAGAARMLVRGLPIEDGIANLKQAVENLDKAQAIK